MEDPIPATPSTPNALYLEEYGNHIMETRRHYLRAFPFRIGRGNQVDAVIASPQVSSRHAEVFEQDGRLWLRDLLSSNGTFWNGEQVVDPVPLRPGDVIHVAQVELVLREKVPEPTEGQTIVMPSFGRSALPTFAEDGDSLKEMIAGGLVRPAFQPIIEFGVEGRSRFELLGRGAHPALPNAPGPLFDVAKRHALGSELSETFRLQGLKEAQALPGSPEIFFNTHPDEGGRTLIEGLQHLRESMPDQALTLEMHEAAITNPPAMYQLKDVLRDLDIGLAYDDFGAGQARLLELVEVPPDYLKFDITMIRGIDLAPKAKQQLLQTLVSMVSEMGIQCVAEGIETPQEFDTCFQMGFSMGQGYLMGRPAPVEEWQLGRAKVPEHEGSSSSGA